MTDDAEMSERDATLAAVLRFETNLVLRAGAGSGKTEALTSLAVRLLARGMPPERLVALTFTEKAAAEMRERIARRAADEAIACDAERAQVTTLHSFAASLLRVHALEAGLVPTFSVIEEAGARKLARRAASQAIASAIRTSAPARDLVDASRRTWASARHLPPGLGDLAVAAMLSLGETGATAADLLLRSAYTSERVEAALGSAARHLGVSRSDAYAGHVEHAIGSLVAAHVRAVETDTGARDKVRIASIESCKAVAAWWRARSRLDARQRLAGVASEIAASVRAELRVAPWLAATREHALTLALLGTARSHAEAFVAVVSDASERYGQAKRERGVLDFGDLLLRARALLRDRVDVRRACGDAHDALLVDEVQDTSPVQRDLLRMLHEDPDRPGNLRPRGLFLVGDRKQSIYGFRGADVGVLDELTRDVVASGGRELPLRECFRSLPDLVGATNAIARVGLVASSAHSTETFEVVFDPELDALVPVRRSEGDATARRVELLVHDAPPKTAADARRDEADVIARRIRSLVDQGETRFGDVALLLPRMTHVGRYADAFDAYAVPYVVEGGRGLLETEECTDLLSLASLVSGEIDDVALAAVLRSPFVALSDLSLVSIVTSRGALPALAELAACARDGWPESTPWELERLARFAVSATDAARDLDHTGIAAALRGVVDATAYDAVLAAMPDAEGRVANLDLLLTSAASFDDDPRVWARTQRERIAAGETEREADLATADMDVVHVMTVHQSKGREHPVVVVADCGRAHADPPRFIGWDTALGLAVRVPLPTEGTWLGPGDAIAARTRARETAERARLLYVAATRARDRLIFVGEGRGGTWRSLLDTIPDELLSRRPYSACGAPPATRKPAARPTCHSNDGPPRITLTIPAPSSLSVGALAVADLAVCARRHRSIHDLHVGAPEATRLGPTETPYVLALAGSPLVELHGHFARVIEHEDATYDVITRAPVPANGLEHLALLANISRLALARATGIDAQRIRSGLVSEDGQVLWIDPISQNETALAAYVRDLVLARTPPPHAARDLPVCQSLTCPLLRLCHGDRIDVIKSATTLGF